MDDGKEELKEMTEQPPIPPPEVMSPAASAIASPIASTATSM